MIVRKKKVSFEHDENKIHFSDHFSLGFLNRYASIHDAPPMMRSRSLSVPKMRSRTLARLSAT